jgi:hypothetical protein
MKNYLLFIFFILFFSCSKEKKEETVVNSPKELNTKNEYEIDSIQFKKDMAEYLKAQKEIDSLWDDLAGGAIKISKRKKPNFEAISKKIISVR